MGEWYCFKCNQKMEKTEVAVTYLGYTRSSLLPTCPKCGIVFATADLADKAKFFEEMLEDKPQEEH